jgi:hypothetical protein
MGAQWEDNGDAMGTQRPVSCCDAFPVSSVALFSGGPPVVFFALHSCCVVFLSVLRCVGVKLLSATLRSSCIVVVFPLRCPPVRCVAVSLALSFR